LIIITLVLLTAESIFLYYYGIYLLYFITDNAQVIETTIPLLLPFTLNVLPGAFRSVIKGVCKGLGLQDKILYVQLVM
jgi:Na+-driven multidrug efflux pump